MSWITIASSMGASACLTLATVHLVIWCKQTDQWAHLLFSLTAVSVATIAALELLAMHAQSPEQFGKLMWWAHLPVFIAITSIVGFVRLYFKTGRPWLAYSVCGLRLLDLIINFFSVPNANYERITGLRHVKIFGGETISLAQGVENPWVRVSELSSLLFLVFVVDASLVLWRRGHPRERRRALIVGGSMIFFILVAAGTSALIEAGVMRSPYLISFSFLAIVAAMGYELSSDVVRAARLARQLQASEAASRESEERFRILADTAPVMVWMSGTDMLCNFFNKPWLEFTGRTLEQELGNGWSEGVHADDLKRCLALYFSSFEVQQSFTMEYRLRRADGEYRWVLDTGVPRYVPDGEFAGYIGSAIDITERRLAEAALRESEQNMNLAAVAAELAMWSWDIPRDEIWTTDQGWALFGIPNSGRISFKNFLHAVYPEDRETVYQAVNEALKGSGDYDSEYRVKQGDKMRWIAARGRVEFVEHQAVRVRGVLLDITLRKQAEERFRLVVEAAPNAMIMVNAEGKIDLINAEVEAVFGYTRQELIGRPVEILVPDRFRSEHPSHRREYLGDPRVRAMGAGRELFGRRKDGSEVPVEIGLSPLHTSAGLFVLASIVDITERRDTELESARQRNELAHLSRVGLLGELSVSLAHELNQPLTAILGNTQAAQLLLAEGAVDHDELSQILSEIVQESKRAGEVIRRLRALLRKGETRRVPLDMNQVVENVMKLMRSDLINQHVTIDVELAPDLPLVDGDEIQLQQVLLNLVVNACDAMAQVEALNRGLAISTELAGSKAVRVSVADHGCGIPPEKVEGIFEPFFTTKETGTGLGLAVCRTIITAHGGKLWAANNPGSGATVQFTLPAIVQSE
ncbi:MAG: PAS domain S-box protein [Verrucomicrobia bacterium]|nr:PAS domain S-box protein [Verrucomicrobiota bacterium]MBV8483061.1 PAS domain S-box protein [Verrucomicrobiota bacterium]